MARELRSWLETPPKVLRSQPLQVQLVTQRSGPVAAVAASTTALSGGR